MIEYFHLFGGLGGILGLSGVLVVLAAFFMNNVGEERNPRWKLYIIGVVLNVSGVALLSDSAFNPNPRSHKSDFDIDRYIDQLKACEYSTVELEEIKATYEEFERGILEVEELDPIPLPGTASIPVLSAAQARAAAKLAEIQSTRLEENKARLEELSQSPLWFTPHTAVTPTKKNGNRTGAICQDGWQSRATGRGACSHHRGVRYWLYE